MDVLCVLVDHNRQLIGSYFEVQIEDQATIMGLKNRVKEAAASNLRHVGALDLVVLRPTDPSALMVERGELQAKVKELYERDELEMLGSLAKIGDLKIDNEVLVVQIGRPDPQTQGGYVLEPHLSPVPQEYHNVIMSAHRKGIITAEDLKLSRIVEEQSPNARIQEFQKLLQRPRRFDEDEAIRASYERAKKIVALPKPNASGSYNSAPSDSNNSAMPNPHNNAFPEPNDRTMSTPELNLEADNDSEDFANAAIFFPFSFGLRQNPDFEFRFSDYSWPFKLFIRVAQKLYSYRPKSDFLFSSGLLPRFFAQVQSEPYSTEDKFYMLLQAGSLLQFVNTHMEKYQEKKDLSLVVAYIDKFGRAERMIVYQDQNDDKVKYTKPRIFNLNAKTELLEFLRELYNLASWVATESEEDVADASIKVSSLKAALNAAAKKPGVSAWTTKPSRNQSEDEFTEQEPASQRWRTGDGRDEFAEQLEVAGYEVEPLVFEDSLGVPPPSRIRTVYKRSDVEQKTPLIAKRIRKSSSQELEILQYLHAKPSVSPYIIALVAHFAVDTATYLIFPALARIYEESLRHGEIKQPCQSLVNGVAYLHANRVAHLDLKLDNLLYDKETGQLKIIDFDIAVRVKDEDQEIEGYRGTPGCTAPEMGNEGGPKRRYSAIKADRWACGLVLKTFLKYEPTNGFSTLAERLMATDPSERPSLVEWCNTLAVRGDSGGAKDMKLAGTTVDHRRKHSDDCGVLEPLAKKTKTDHAN
ncbi:hypothetical protein EST38_g5794 [Candolleomyces aberdarensis]|uniref:Protein kinase domain-containing protein n=1 Tax=Candolleomyces aberdarensis TaxID=2316362 RepID=A0A4V1Q3W8_9AGAR|nr:hypothetical protein EST38_g5794 [Candolleomyces aberdarensis]